MKKTNYTKSGAAKTGLWAVLTLLMLCSPFVQIRAFAHVFPAKTAEFAKKTAEVFIRGRVTDDAGNPLAGATVAVKGTTFGAAADGDGYYSLRIPESVTATILVVSYTGYTAQEIAISGRQEINITLLQNANQLGELVVIGYGTQNRKDLTGSVGSVNVQSISKVPTNDRDQGYSRSSGGRERPQRWRTGCSSTDQNSRRKQF